eukprot:GGOE01023296.1.p1 GENE.GGOE01023296.1~~GGOE01023296.1.p1  ORF type:complete len:127 (-),score=6.74 GGOE01023296.1:301-681(-)
MRSNGLHSHGCPSGSCLAMSASTYTSPDCTRPDNPSALSPPLWMAMVSLHGPLSLIGDTKAAPIREFFLALCPSIQHTYDAHTLSFHMTSDTNSVCFSQEDGRTTAGEVASQLCQAGVQLCPSHPA